MKSNLKKKITGAAIAAAAASIVGCAQTSGGTTNTSASSGNASGTTDLVHCYGVNVCNGHNDCKTAENSCAGHASCKGTGFVGMPAKSCADVGGKVKDSWRGAVSQTDLSKCYDVNVCKGHNDCKTADNACGGHASCKGTGFVFMPAKSCGDIGGKTKS